MRLSWSFTWLAIPTVLAFLCAGCGGINASQGVSPASFFLPGLMRTNPTAETNTPATWPPTAPELVLAK